TYSVGETARRQDGDRGGAGLAGDEGEGSGIRREGEVGDGHRRGDFNGHGGGVDQVPARARDRDRVRGDRRRVHRADGRLTPDQDRGGAGRRQACRRRRRVQANIPRETADRMERDRGGGGVVHHARDAVRLRGQGEVGRQQ